MKSRKIVYSLVASAFVLGWTSYFAKADDPPKDDRGFSTSKTTVVELGPEFDSMTGRQLRLRVLTIDPGGYIGLHSHKDRPAVVYFLQGTDTVIGKAVLKRRIS